MSLTQTDDKDLINKFHKQMLKQCETVSEIVAILIPKWVV